MPTKRFVLVVGGAGYIGSHMVHHLNELNYHPIVLDNFSTGHRHAVKNVECIEGDLADRALLDSIFKSYSISTVMHFASFIQVGESVEAPLKYYQNNVSNTLNLLEAMKKNNVKQFIFSSSAAVYGEPNDTPIDESHPLLPLNPYGHSKQMIEQVLMDCAKAYGMQFVSLRYFNAAGANAKAGLVECHDPETHLIPLILEVALKKREAITVYGRDYPTPDGTCIRDYIHVIDLCRAHALAIHYLDEKCNSAIFNLGTGKGYSVQEVIDKVALITGCDIPVIEGERRSGDPAILVADPERAREELGWVPCCSDLASIVQDAWDAKKVEAWSQEKSYS